MHYLYWEPLFLYHSMRASIFVTLKAHVYISHCSPSLHQLAFFSMRSCTKDLTRSPSFRIQACSNLGVDNWFRARLTDNVSSTQLDCLCTLLTALITSSLLIKVYGSSDQDHQLEASLGIGAQESGLFPRAQTCSHWVFNKCDYCNSTFNWTRFPSNLLRKILNNRIPYSKQTL